MSDDGVITDLETLAAAVPDGSLVAVPPDYAGVPMAATRALVRRGSRALKLLAVPSSGMQADLLIGAGCLAAIETAAVSLGEAGVGPRFAAALRAGALAVTDSTCPAIHAALQAAEKGVPFMPLRGMIGSDIARHRSDWRIIDNPFGEDDPIILLPAIVPDIALVHAPLADRAGNLWVGRRRELVSMAHAARTTFATVEAIHEGDLIAEPRYAAGTIPALYVSRIAVAAEGAWPVGLEDGYPPDAAHQALYARMARTDEGFAAYLARYVLDERRAA